MTEYEKLSYRKKLLDCKEDEMDNNIIKINSFYNNQPTLNYPIIFVTSLVFLFFITIQYIGFLRSNSIAILTDSMHLLSNFIGLILSIISDIYINKPSNKTYSFGYKRLEVIFSLLLIFFIVLLCFNLSIQSISRIIDEHHTVIPNEMLIYSSLGLVFNLTISLIVRNKVNYYLKC